MRTPETARQLATRRYDLERESRDERTEHITDLALGALFTRDQGLSQIKKGTQSISYYNEWGEAIDKIKDPKTGKEQEVPHNPAVGEFALTLRRKVSQLVSKASYGLTETDMDSMTMIFPQLVQVISLDRRFVTQVYEKDFPEIFEVAMDWFLHPSRQY